MKTNRRNFIKGVTGFITVIYAAFVPKAKSESLTLERLYHIRDELEKAEKSHKYPTLDEVLKAERTEEVNPYSISSRQQHLIGTCLITREGFRFRYTSLVSTIIDRKIWYWMPENEFIANPPEEYLIMLNIEA